MESSPDARVVFPLDVRDGWPPVASERLWAFSLGNGLYRVNNVPWFVRNLAVDDVVSAEAGSDEVHPVFRALVEPSSHITVRVIVLRSGPLLGELQPVVDVFAPLGVYVEGVQQYGMVALDIPPEAPLRQIHDRLLLGEAAGSWAWEEGRVTNAWEAAKQPTRRRWLRRDR